MPPLADAVGFIDDDEIDRRTASNCRRSAPASCSGVVNTNSTARRPILARARRMSPVGIALLTWTASKPSADSLSN